MFCIIAFVVLSILGIFSASNRQLAREALDCVLRRVTLRPCNTGFDEKMKAKILGFVIVRSERGAMMLNKYFEPLAWVFFVLLMASGIWTVRGLYMFYTTGSCNGLNSSSFCVFDPTGTNNEVSELGQCSVTQKTSSGLTIDGVDLSTFPTLNPSSSEKIVMIACYHCDYSRKAYPQIRALAEKTNASFTFIHYPVKEPNDYFSKLAYVVNRVAPDKFWQLNDRLFEGDKVELDDPNHINQILTDLGLDPKVIQGMVSDPLIETAVKAQMEETTKTGFYGTPTIFINGKAFVGPKPYRVYGIALGGLLYWLK